MRSRVLIIALVGAACIAALPTVSAGAAGRPAARMLVYAQEWSLWPSRSALPAGRVIVQLWNRGQDAHDLRIRRLGWQRRMIGRAQGVAVTRSGSLNEASWRLAPGRYELYCSMSGHLAHGMRVTLVLR